MNFKNGIRRFKVKMNLSWTDDIEEIMILFVYLPIHHSTSVDLLWFMTFIYDQEQKTNKII